MIRLRSTTARAASTVLAGIGAAAIGCVVVGLCYGLAFRADGMAVGFIVLAGYIAGAVAGFLLGVAASLRAAPRAVQSPRPDAPRLLSAVLFAVAAFIAAIPGIVRLLLD